MLTLVLLVIFSKRTHKLKLIQNRQMDVPVRVKVCVCVSDDHSRITLKVENSQSNSDYINASPIVSTSSAF